MAICANGSIVKWSTKMNVTENCDECGHHKQIIDAACVNVFVTEYCLNAKKEISPDQYEAGYIPDWCPLPKV